MWYTQDCQKCGKEIWDIHYLISSFMESNNVFFCSRCNLQFLVAAEVWNGDDELVKKYNIPENHESLELRLFVGSADSPISPSEDDDNWVCFFSICNNRLSGSKQIVNLLLPLIPPCCWITPTTIPSLVRPKVRMCSYTLTFLLTTIHRMCSFPS